MESGPLSDARVQGVLKGFVRVKIDPRAGTTDKELAQQYGVASVPNYRVLDPSGGQIQKIEIYGTPPEESAQYYPGELQPVAAQYPGR